MKTINNAKLAAKEFMDSFHPDREWWIVGGCLRDTDMGLPFKDIDIFINGYDTDLLPDTGTDAGEKNAYLLRAYTVDEYPYKGEKYEINLIFMRGDRWSLETMSDRCDFGICQVGWCPVSDREYRSNLYVQDKANKTLTLARSTAAGRLTRMKNKFPGHTLRNPEMLTLDDKKFWSYDKMSGTLKIKYTQLLPEVPV